MHKRLKKRLIMLAVLLSAGVIYYLLAMAGLRIPCMFNYVTGYYCPGCGVTRMCINLLQLNIYKAFRSNPAVFVLLPFLAAIFIRQFYCEIRYGTIQTKKWLRVTEIVIALLLIVFGILRNIPAFYYLKPL